MCVRVGEAPGARNGQTQMDLGSSKDAYSELDSHKAGQDPAVKGSFRSLVKLYFDLLKHLKL